MIPYIDSPRVQSAAVRGILLLFCLAVLGAPAARSQEEVETNPERGFSPGRTYAISEIENVDVIGGNLNVQISLASLPPGRAGMTAGVNLIYNSQLYDLRLDYSKNIYQGGIRITSFRR